MRTRRLRDALHISLFVILQFLSGLYYGLFLVLTLTWVCPILYLASLYRAKARGAQLAAALVVAGIIVTVAGLLYGRVFATALGQQGERSLFEIHQYSATLHDFVVVPQSNRLYSRHPERFTSPERTFFPGATAILLASCAFARHHKRRMTLAIYSLIFLFGALAGLGLNAPLYDLLYRLLPPVRSLRAPARFGIFYLFGLSVLCAIGVDQVLELLARSKAKSIVAAVLVLMLCVEYASRPTLTRVATVTPAAYSALNKLPFGPIAELPMPHPDALPGPDPQYEYLSTFHWRPMLNGYSGFYPESYLQLLETVTSDSLPGAWLAAIENAHAEYILFHVNYASPDTDVARVMYLKTSSKWVNYGIYPGAGDLVWLFGRGR
jgi:hypothetical protein